MLFPHGLSVSSSDPGAAGAEGPGVPGADAGGSAAGEGAPRDAAAREGGGEERQRHPAAPEAAEGGRTHPGGLVLDFNVLSETSCLHF